MDNDSKDSNLHEGHRKRLRQSYMQRQSLDGFQDHQILELLLFYAVKRQDVNPLAHRLINRFGSLRLVLSAGTQALMDAGLSENSAALLSLVNDVGRAMDMKEAFDAVINNMDDALKLCHGILFREKAEVFAAVCLDAKNRVTRICTRTDGLAGSVSALPRWIADIALTTKTHAIILAHNHPSGSADPSTNDITSTHHMRELLSAIGVDLYDHIIVSHSECFSIARNYKKHIDAASRTTEDLDNTDMEVM